MDWNLMEELQSFISNLNKLYNLQVEIIQNIVSSNIVRKYHNNESELFLQNLSKPVTENTSQQRLRQTHVGLLRTENNK